MTLFTHRENKKSKVRPDTTLVVKTKTGHKPRFSHPVYPVTLRCCVRSQCLHESMIKSNIVNGGKTQCQEFIHTKQMSDIRARKCLTRHTVTMGIKRRFIKTICLIGHMYLLVKICRARKPVHAGRILLPHKKESMTRIARRQNTIK